MLSGGGGRSRRRGRTPDVLPSNTLVHRSEHPISCWYCDFKVYAFNDILFNLGWKYARLLKVWFSVGVYFSLFAVVGVSMMLLWNSISAFHFGGGSFSFWFENLLVSGYSVSMMDAAIIVVSTLVSIAFHEFGHAIAAASEGLQIEYIAIFLAVLFPGALVALNYDQVQNLPLFSKLRIYCAGIWHNVMFCAVCVLMLLLLPLALYPLYTHGEGLMVLGVLQTSPLSGYLSAHDVIVSVDGLNITRTDEWIEMLAQDNAETIANSHSVEGSQSYGFTSAGKGYCVPNSWIDASKSLWRMNDQLSCPDELLAFENMSCNRSSILAANNGGGSGKNEAEDRHCLIAKDVVTLKKCGSGWQRTEAQGSNCVCSEEESCLVPALAPGMSWIEISYTSPYSLECLQQKGNLSSSDSTNNLGSSPCEGTFVYVGDLLSAARSVKLSSSRPRWTFLLFGAHVPYILENALGCFLRVSAALGVVNCLPVYFLDGEAILETSLCYFPWFTRRQQRKILRFCLFLWTVLSIITFSRILYSVLSLS